MKTELKEIIAVVNNDFLSGENDPAEIAAEWDMFGFTSDDVEKWAWSGCFDPVTAADFKREGITPDQVAIEYAPLETIGYRVSNGDMKLKDAIKAIAAAE